MSTTIDSRVVEMRFDNQNFEQNVSKSMSTLDKLKQKLHLTGASKGLEDVNKAAKNVDMSPLGKGVEQVGIKFNALNTIADQALRNITNSAMAAGKNIVKALTIDPVKTGFQEYETQINAVQTILANTQSKGTTIDDVNKALDELNKYADMTIYNFTEMTRNIGTFTAAGIDLDTSVNAIQGIANLAAVSGSNSQQASTAMYQLSQALAAGTVKLMDWNSVVNAGMGGQVFQDALRKTSEELGTGAEAAIKASGSFRESLKDGWITSEVLTETLKKFTTSGANEYISEFTGLSMEAIDAELKKVESIKDEEKALDVAAEAMAKMSGKSKDQIKEALTFAKTAQDAATKVKTFTQLWDVLKEAAQSGWTQTWEIIIGDFEEAKALFTPLSDFLTGMINKMSDWRNTMLEKALGSPFGGILDKIKETTAVAKKAVETVENLDEIAKRVINGDFGNVDTGRREKLTEAGYNWAKVQNRVNEMLGCSVRHATDLGEETEKLTGEQEKLNESQATTIEQLLEMTDAQLKELGLTEEEIKSLRNLAKYAEMAGVSLKDALADPDILGGRNLLIESFKNMAAVIGKSLAPIRDAWKEIFPPVSAEERGEQLYGLIAALHNFTTELDISSETVDNIKRTFKGLFAALDIVTTLFGSGFKLALKGIQVILGAFDLDILSATAHIGDMIVAFRDFLFSNEAVTKGLELLGKGIRFVVDLFQKFYNEIMAIPEVAAAIDKVKTRVTNMCNSIRESISGFLGDLRSGNLDFSGMVEVGRNIVQGLINGVREYGPMVVSALFDLGSQLIAAVKDVLGIHSPSTVMIAIGGFIIAGLVLGLTQGFPQVGEALKGLGTRIKEGFSNIDFSSLFAGAVSVGLVAIVKKFADTISNLTSPMENAGEALGGIAEAMVGAGKAMKGFGFKMRTEGIKNIAATLLILVGAVAVLTFLDQDKLWSAVGVIGALAGILTVLVGVIEGLSILSNKFGGGAINFGALSIGLAGIGVSILLLASAVKKIGGLNPSQAQRGFAGLTVLIVEIGALLAAYGLLVKGKSAQNISKVGGLMLKLSVALLLMVGVIKLVSGMKTEDLLKGGGFILGFVGIVAAMTAITKIGGKSVPKLGGMMVKMSFALMLMVGVVKLINTLTNEELVKGGIVILGFVGIVTLLTLITKMSNGVTTKLGGTLLAISASMLIMVGVVKLLSGMKPEDIMKGEVAILGFVGIIAALATIMKKTGPEIPKMAGNLLAMSVAIGILAGVAIMLGLIDITALAKGIVAVGLLGGVMTAMIWATRGAENCKGNLVVMTVAIVALASAAAVLSMIDTTKLVTATASMSLMMGMFAVIIKSSKYATGSIGPLIVMTLAVGMIGGMLYLLSGLPVESSLATAASLSVLLLAISSAMFIISKAGYVAPTALISIGIMTLIVGALGGIIYLLKDMPVDTTIGIANSLSKLLLALSASCAILTVVGAFGAAAFIGVGALSTLIVAVGGIMVAIGALAEKFPQLESFLNTGLPLLEKIGYGLGSFFGNIIGGFMGGITSGLPQMGTDLGNFMTNAQPFFDGVKGITEESIAGVKALAETFLILSGANLAEGLASFLTGESSLATFGNQLPLLGYCLRSFVDNLGDFGPDQILAVSAAASAIKTLAQAAEAIPNEGGWIAKIVGDNSIGAFGGQLATLGTNLRSFVDNLGEFDESAITAVKGAASAIKELALAANEIPNEGGWAAKILGDNSLATFGAQLPLLAYNLKQFAVNLEGFGEEQINSIVGAAKAIKEMALAANEIPNEGGWAAKLFGDNSIATFGSQLPMLGTNLSMFATNLGTFDEAALEKVKFVAEAIKTLANAGSSIDGQSEWAKTLFGDNSLATFGSQLPMLGTNLGMFATNLGTFDEATVATVNCAASAIKALAQAGSSIDGQSEWAKKIFGDNGLGAFSEELGSVGSSLATFVANLGTFSEGQVATVKSAVSAIKAFASLADTDLKAAKDNLPGFGDTLPDLATNISTFATNMPDVGTVNIAIANIKSILKAIELIAEAKTGAIKDFTSELKTLGEDGVQAFVDAFASAAAQSNVLAAAESLIDSFITGVKAKETDVDTAFSDIASSGADTLDDDYTSFYDAGVYLVEGFAAGITATTWQAEAKAEAMAKAAKEAAEEALGIESPSKVFYKIGSFTGLGFVNALGDYASKSYKAATNMADYARKGLTKAVASINDYINSDIDTQPTIRPVLDLDDLKSQAGSIGRLFDTPATVGVLADVSAISSMMNMNQNGGNHDVVSALNKLRGNLTRPNQYYIDGITYDDGSNVSDAVSTLIRAARIERRI